MRNPFRAGNYKSDSKSLGRSDTQNGVYYFHSALLGLSRFSSAAQISFKRSLNRFSYVLVFQALKSLLGSLLGS